MNNAQSLVIVAILALSVTRCKDSQENSSLRTLDNIASENPFFDACAGTGQIHGKADLGAYPHLKAALAAVPLPVQIGFFDDLGGKIRIVTDATLRDCAINNDRVDEGLSCWRRLPNRNESIEIIIRKTSREKEQYALVRAFGFVYGDILLNRVIPGDTQAPVTLGERPTGHLRDYKAHLASIFLGDLLTITPPVKVQETIATLVKFGLTKNVVRESDFQKRWVLFSNLPEAVQDRFASRVFAEAFQSQFCTKASADRACKLFGNTMRSFAPYAQDITSPAWLTAHACTKEDRTVSLAASSSQASSARVEWFSQHGSEVARRRAQGLEAGSLVNAKIAEFARREQDQFNLTNPGETLSLNGDFLSMIQSLLTGGLSSGGGGGGLGGILSQILGTLGGGAGGSSGGLSGILSSLGLGSSGGSTLGSGGTSSIPPTSGGSNTPLPSSSGGSASTEERAAIDSTNRYRQSQGKEPLQVDEQMIIDCRKQAQMQADRGGLQHWLYPAGVATGENIAYGSNSGESTVMDQWVKSPPHHANIMSNYRYIGIGNVGNQWCQRFR